MIFIFFTFIFYLFVIIYIFKMDDMGYAQAISEGNALTRSVAEHNESIRQNNQLLVQAYTKTLDDDKDKSEEDKAIHGSEDIYGSATALATVAQGFQRVKEAGGFIPAFKADAQAVADKFQGAKSYISQKISGNPSGEAEAGDAAVAETKTVTQVQPFALPEGAPTLRPKNQQFEQQRQADIIEAKGGEQNLTAEDKAGFRKAMFRAKMKDTAIQGAFEQKFDNLRPTAFQKVQVTVDPKTGGPPGQAAAPSEPTPDPTGTSSAGDVADDISKKVAGTGDELAGKILGGIDQAKSAFKTATKVGKIAGVGLGVVNTVEGIADIADGAFAKMDEAHKASSVLQDAGGLLDIASVFLPVLAPAAAITSVASAIDTTVTDVADDRNKQNNDQKNEQNQINQNKQNMQTSTSFQSIGMTGNTQQSATAKIAGSGAF
jgi:hypothetical protein